MFQPACSSASMIWVFSVSEMARKGLEGCLEVIGVSSNAADRLLREMVLPRVCTETLRRTFLSSRMLPGQWYLPRAWIARSEIRVRIPCQHLYSKENADFICISHLYQLLALISLAYLAISPPCYILQTKPEDIFPRQDSSHLPCRRDNRQARNILC